MIAVAKIASSLPIVICRVLSGLLHSVFHLVLILFSPILPNHLVLILLFPTTNSSHPLSPFSSPTPTHMSPVVWYHSPSDDMWKPKISKPPVPFPFSSSSSLPSSSSPVLRTPPPTRHFSSDLFSPKLRKLSKKSNDYIKLTSASEPVVIQSHSNHSGTGQSSDTV